MLEQEDIKVVTLPVEASRFGAVESLAEAQKCADLFKTHREEIDGVLVTLPNFGDERAARFHRLTKEFTEDIFLIPIAGRMLLPYQRIPGDRVEPIEIIGSQRPQLDELTLQRRL